MNSATLVGPMVSLGIIFDETNNLLQNPSKLKKC